MASRQLGSVVLCLSLGLSTGAEGKTVSSGSCSRQEPIWGRAARNASGAYCTLVDRARARLSSDPKEASALSDKAIQLRPEAVEARLIRAHALQLLGDSRRAHEEFSAAVPNVASADLSGVLTPPLVTAGARAALMSGQYAAALERYRWVVLRLSGLHNQSDEARVLIEAATAVMYAGPGGVREATAYLTQAVGKNAPLQRPIAEAVWVLALFRDGQRDRSKSLARRFESSWWLVWIFEGQKSAVGARSESLPVLPAGESWALAAAVAEAVEVKGAEIHWQAFYEAAQEHLPPHLQRGSVR